MLERLKAGDIKNLESFLKDAAKVIRNRLASENLTDLNRARAEAQLAALTNELRAIYQKAGRQIDSDISDFASYSSSAEVRALQSVVVEQATLAVPSAVQIISAAKARPMTGGKTAVMLEPFIKGWETASVTAIENSIRLGYLQGRTNQELVREVIGTASNKYQDGLVDTTRRNAQAVVRTAIQHVAQVAKQETWKENADIITGYEWVSVLDSRTTVQCQSLSGREFEIGKGPLPPIHINCRSTTAPIIANKVLRDALRKNATQASKGAEGGAQVSANLNYYEWLKTQPDSFQDEALGPLRAKLFRDGGLSAERFQELQLGKQFEPLNLYGKTVDGVYVPGMKDLEPVAFNRAGL